SFIIFIMAGTRRWEPGRSRPPRSSLGLPWPDGGGDPAPAGEKCCAHGVQSAIIPALWFPPQDSFLFVGEAVFGSSPRWHCFIFSPPVVSGLGGTPHPSGKSPTALSTHTTSTRRHVGRWRCRAAKTAICTASRPFSRAPCTYPGRLSSVRLSPNTRPIGKSP